MEIEPSLATGELNPQQQLREQLIMQAFSNALSAEQVSRAVQAVEQVTERAQAGASGKGKYPPASPHKIDILV